jgi:hypothetical protein
MKGQGKAGLDLATPPWNPETQHRDRRNIRSMAS